MGQNEIFKLLLIILLLINGDNSGNGECNGLTGNLNQIIIILLLLGFNPSDSSTQAESTTF